MFLMFQLNRNYRIPHLKIEAASFGIQVTVGSP